jgi:hypothetical protein
MDDRPISEGVQASLTRILQASHLTGRHSGHVNPRNEQRGKYRGDLDNEKKIPLILPEYIPPLAGIVNTTISPDIMSILCSLHTF